MALHDDFTRGFWYHHETGQPVDVCAVEPDQDDGLSIFFRRCHPNTLEWQGRGLWMSETSFRANYVRREKLEG